MRATFLIVVLIFAVPVAAADIEVDLELVLAVDGSASVDFEEFRLQMIGFATAFRDPGIIDGITSGRHGRIAVALMLWSGRDAPVAGVGWHLISDRSTADRFARALLHMPRAVRPGATAINYALLEALHQLDDNGYKGTRQVIDLSADGKENNLVDSLAPIDIGRREAIARNVTINGLPIMTDEPDLEHYFRRTIIGGPGAFLIRADDYTDFGRAIRVKLLREIRSGMLVGMLEPTP